MLKLCFFKVKKIFLTILIILQEYEHNKFFGSNNTLFLHNTDLNKIMPFKNINTSLCRITNV